MSLLEDPSLIDDQGHHATQSVFVVDEPVLRPGHYGLATHTGHAGSDPSAVDQASAESQVACVDGISDTRPDHSDRGHHCASVGSGIATGDHTRSDTHSNPGVGGPFSSQPATTSGATPTRKPSSGWLELRIWAEMFDDAQKARIANVNRAERGGVDPLLYEAHLATLARAEHECRLQTRRCLRRVAPKSILEWQKATNGIGIDLLARLLGHLGHPAIATPHHWEGTGSKRVLIADDPYSRTVAQLWQFCGHGAPGRKTRGMTVAEANALGNPILKMLVHLNAEACMKCTSSPFRRVYDDTRDAVADKVHTADCVRCGPSGKPAQIGTPWNPGHQHAHALRIVGKEILRELWIVAS